MALSPAQRSQLRKRAAKEAAASAPAHSMAGATTYELQLLQLAQDRARLKQIQSEQGKAELKRQLLPAYAPYVEGVLSAGQGAQDEVLTTLMVWRMDAGDYAGALDIAEYVLRHGLLMPDRFARTTGCLVAEEIANAALKAQKAGGTFDLAVLERTQKLTAAQDMPDEARAKLLLATGRATLDGEAPGLPRLLIGIDLLKRAIDLHSSCGGKKDLERAERLLKNIAAPEAPEASAAAD
ncbi:Phage small terminase subunit [Azotobacter beijerinckii]|uniref:Phage small terminase subunit n=1 Tax=Azotobacter beijerinckii TaxID=170623 RepID=A0A1H6TUB4_9GAMM|nr:phage terminase small subunit [Azotobacter beijerinckii]SEI83653.1 Phage small terminase subunit [Azotobacter beijerinckii]